VKKKDKIELPEYKFSVELNPVPIEEEPISSSISQRLKQNPEYMPAQFYIAAQDIQRTLGFLPPLDSSVTDTTESFSRYVPLREKKAILQRASDAKREKLLSKWGVKDRRELLHDSRYQQQLLQQGKASLSLVLPTVVFSEQDVKLARHALAYDPHAEVPATEGAVTAQERRAAQKAAHEARAAAKRLRAERKSALKRREALQRAQDERRTARRDALLRAVPGLEAAPVAPDVSPDAVIIGGTLGTLPAAAPAGAKRKNTLADMKEELQRQKDRIKELSNLEKAGDYEELERRKEEQGWEEAMSRLTGKKVSNHATAARAVRQATARGKTAGAKLAAALKAQDAARHKRLVKKMGNVRERRVTKQAAKVIKLQKGGRVIPGYN